MEGDPVTCHVGPLAVLCVGPPSIRISRPARPGAKKAPETVEFEMHAFCGPMPIDRKGNGRSLAPSHWFWTAVTQWCQQGQEVDELGRCQYDPTIPVDGEEG